jgi:hypothetical protein
MLAVHLERVKGIEPSYSAWEAAALPLSYTRAPPVFEPETPAMQGPLPLVLAVLGRPA